MALEHAEEARAAFGRLAGCSVDALASILLCAAAGHRVTELEERVADARRLALRVSPQALGRRRLVDVLGELGELVRVAG